MVHSLSSSHVKPFLWFLIPSFVTSVLLKGTKACSSGKGSSLFLKKFIARSRTQSVAVYTAYYKDITRDRGFDDII